MKLTGREKQGLTGFLKVINAGGDGHFAVDPIEVVITQIETLLESKLAEQEIDLLKVIREIIVHAGHKMTLRDFEEHFSEIREGQEE